MAFTLTDPDRLGSSEYRAIHDLITDQIEYTPDEELDEMAIGILEEFIYHARTILTHDLGQPEPRVILERRGGSFRVTNPEAIPRGIVVETRDFDVDRTDPAGLEPSTVDGELAIVAVYRTGD